MMHRLVRVNICQNATLLKITCRGSYLVLFVAVSVSSGDVTAQIVRGNITVANGVIHVIDRLLGFVYNSALEQIQQDTQ